LRGRFARVALTAATVWAAVSLYLSIVPSYAGELLSTKNLALLAALATVALLASCAAQVLSRRWSGSPRRDQSIGLVALAVGLVAAAWQAGVALTGWESYPASSPLSPRSRRASPRSRSLRSFFTERPARRAPPPRARPHARPRR